MDKEYLVLAQNVAEYYVRLNRRIKMNGREVDIDS